MKQYITQNFNISPLVFNLGEEVLKSINFSNIDETARYNQLKVLKAFQNNRVSDVHFNSTTGYGYDDAGRETIDNIYAEVFGAEDALVRHNIINGTHAISLCLFAVLRPGDTLVAVTGKPYDTLEEVIGICGDNNGSLKDFGINYRQVDLLDGRVDYNNIMSTIDNSTKAVIIQKSKGYSFRPSLSCDDIAKIINTVKTINPNTVCIVDNCYGEFTEKIEPTNVGADLIAGSLIKNPGGGLVSTGGYIAGKKEYVELASYKLNSVGLGKHVGATLGINKEILQGLFMAPVTVANSLKTALFCGAIYEKLGFTVSPSSFDARTDIIQAIKFGTEEGVVKFCQGIQQGAPVDSFVSPEPWDMPGYSHQVIMAAGVFNQGSSIELSADGPIKEPYIAYMQGGLTFESGYLGVLKSVQKLYDEKIICL